MTQELSVEQATTSPPALKGIHHVGITVSDVERSEEWYGRVLGMKRLFQEEHHESDAGGYAIILGNEIGTFNIGIDHHPANKGSEFTPTRTGLDHLCLSVGAHEDVERWADHLTSQGVEHSGIVEIEGMPLAVVNFKDPDGIAIEFISIN